MRGTHSGFSRCFSCISCISLHGAVLGLLLLTLALAGSIVTGGCARRAGAPPGAVVAEPPGPIEPLRVFREDLSDAGQRKLHVKLVVAADAVNEQIDELIRRVATAERLDDGVLWISVFLEGMDLNSVAYAFGIARPGAATIPITHRDSLQTYR